MIVADGFKGKRVAVFGLARSGLSAARALAAGGAQVTAWDDGEAARAGAAALGVPLADPAQADWTRIAALVLAPGVPLTHPRPHDVVRRARAAGVPVIGDMELFARSAARGRARVVLITGTNGKSTTTALAAHLLGAAGVPVAVGGNLGTAVLDLDPVPDEGVYVFEVSSYQIDLIETLVPDVGVLLNITPDHLDRHGGMDGYVAVKARLFRGQGPGQAAVIGVDDAYCAGIADRVPGRVVRVGAAQGDVTFGDGILREGGRDVFDLKSLPRLAGRHNWQNAAAAFAALRALGLSVPAATAGLPDFPGLAHRMELVGERAGVRFVNDSKATNADAAARALATFEPVFWILGGVPKATGLAGLEAYYPRIRRAYLIGRAADAFAAALKGRVDTVLAGDLARAVTLAARDAQGEAGKRPVVLLSPACASFDQFRDYEERGDRFRALVAALPREAAV